MMSKGQSGANIQTMAAECIALRVRTLTRVISGLYDDALRPLGLKISQLNILVAAARLGQARPAQVCEILQMDASTLSRNVERMRAKGWLELVPKSDARLQTFRPSAAGRRLIERSAEAWQRAQGEARGLLGPEGELLLRNVARGLGQPAQ